MVTATKTTTQTANKNDRRVPTLVRLLGDLAGAHEDLLAAIDAKIAAMRTADAEQIRAACLQESAIAERINEREGLRRQLVENIMRGYGLSPTAARRLSAAQIAARLGGRSGEDILTAAGRLKELTGAVTRRNHVAQLIAQNVLRHVKHVFTAMTGAETSPGYTHAGESVACRPAIFDAVG